MSKYKTETVISAIEKYSGNVSQVARALGTSRRVIYDYIHRHATVKQALQDAREEMLDVGESALYRAVIRGEAWAVCFLLKTQGKGRGYVERQELTGKDGEELTVRWVNDWRNPTADTS